MERVRLSADVEPDLRRRVRIAAAKSDRKVSEWIAEAVRRELEREESETKHQNPTESSITQASVRSFERDWDSEDDAVYDELAG
jgi:hypothetical protein